MNLPYIQSEIFRELVGMETRLKRQFRLRIMRSTAKNIHVLVYDMKNWKPYTDEWYITPISKMTGKAITAEVNRIWQEIPAECKREDILK